MNSVLCRPPTNLACAILAHSRRDGAMTLPSLQLDEPGMRELVNSLILEEMARYPAPDYVGEMPPLPCGPDGTFASVPASSAVKADLEAISSGAMRTPFDAHHFDFPTTPDADADITVWEAALARAKVAVEAQLLASINLELFNKYAVDAWKTHVGQLDSIHVRVERRGGEQRGIGPQPDHSVRETLVWMRPLCCAGCRKGSCAGSAVAGRCNQCGAAGVPGGAKRPAACAGTASSRHRRQQL
jgi:hypothetical protein